MSLFISCDIWANEGQLKRKRKYNKLVFSNEGQRSQAITINYPVNIFNDSSIKQDWRDPAKLSTQLSRIASIDTSWKEMSHAQDQEDIWLFENWFFGMENGLILESGALNGILFSNSFLFENFANWTALHVGE